MFNLGEIIDLAIRIEKNGENAYRRAQVEVSDPSLASTLQWLADDEKEHEKWFGRLREEVEVTVEDPKLAEMGRTVLQGVLGDQAFSIQDADFSKIEDLNRLIRLSIEFQKDTILFYEMLTAFIEDDETIRQLEKIVEEENRHVQVLKDFLEKGKALPEHGDTSPE
jgi:rubrerythrin